MEVIRDRDGNVIKRSKNMAVIRNYVSGRNAPVIKVLTIDTIAAGGGKLLILFKDGSSFETNFADLAVLLGFVRRWRNVYGAPLLVKGLACGVVCWSNPALIVPG